jgi:hypothetical protein
MEAVENAKPLARVHAKPLAEWQIRNVKRNRGKKALLFFLKNPTNEKQFLK